MQKKNFRASNLNQLAQIFDTSRIPDNLCKRVLRRVVCSEVVKQFPTITREGSKRLTDMIIGG